MTEPNASPTGTNGASTLHDLFALTDEQILEIEPEAEVASGEWRVASQNLPATSTSGSQRTAERVIPSEPAAGESGDRGNVVATAENGTLVTNHQSPGTDSPPQWLADRMADPQLGAEARELWNAAQLARQGEQSRQEASAFREVFAKPEDARTAAQRARLLDDIDRVYFAGDATQRAELAASMLREDPAAFREMVFVGLRALEQSGQGTATPVNSDTVGARHAVPAHARDGSVISSEAPDPVISRSAATRNPSSSDTAEAPQSKRDSSAPTISNASSMTESSHQSPITSPQFAAYAAFERSANADLERTVGAAIDRTLDQALPNANRADAGEMKSRLAAAIRQDIERALQGDRQLGEQVAQILAPRRLNDEARAQVVRLIGDRAHQLVPTAAKRVLSTWTETTLAAHHARSSRTEAAAARREVAPAHPSGEPTNADSRTAAAATPRHAAHNRLDAGRSAAVSRSATSGSRRLDYRRLSDEQILDL
jgi:hypothetical protein